MCSVKLVVLRITICGLTTRNLELSSLNIVVYSTTVYGLGAFNFGTSRPTL